MKPDMPKVITERPRHGARLKQPKGYKKEMNRIDENSPSSEKIRQKWKKDHNDGKQFSERLGPLFRFLHGKIGQKWDDIYSEICQGLDRGNQVHRHVLTHVNDFVEINVIMIDGVACHNDGILFGRPINTFGGRYNSMYVNPETGLLCESPKYERHKRQPRTDVKRIDENTFVKQIKGIWYKLTVAKFNDESRQTTRQVTYNIGNKIIRSHVVEYLAAYDVAHQAFIRRPHEATNLYGECVYATCKRQLNGEDIKKLKLAA